MAFNKVILIGNMTADPELKQTTSGTSVCSFSIAVNRRFTKEGEQNVDFINVVAWRQQAEFVTKYFKKGKPILVCGQLQTRNWTDNSGNKRYTTEVIADEISFVGSAESDTAPKNEPVANTSAPYIPQAYTGQQLEMSAVPTQAQFEEIPNDDGLPF